MHKDVNPPGFSPLPLSAFEPLGWYRNQLRIQSDGLSGHLDQFWPDIKNSKWIGGEAEGWERLPYWLDGFIPLAVLTKDTEKLARAKRYIDAILEKQQEDGWICPTRTLQERASYDVWAMFLILKVFVVWADATQDGRMEQAIYNALRCLDKHIDRNTLFNWASMRWFECLISIFWLYERRKEQWLVDLCIKLRSQGFDWERFFENWPMTAPNERGHWSQMNHVVNQSMMLKASALWQRIVQDGRGIPLAKDMIEQLDKAHGMVTGMFTGDECLAGRNPSHGTELCSVAEYMYSLQYLVPLANDSFFADRLELIAFNAWPATFDSDMWLHQYDQQVNQMQAIRQKDPIWLTNRPDANTFGLEPDFGCCTANFSQGWPKLSQSVIYQGPDGFKIGAYLPLAASAVYNGTKVRFDIMTDYPFREEILISVQAQEEIQFALYLRIPAFARNAHVHVNGDTMSCTAGEYLVLTRNWHDDRIEIIFEMHAEWIARDNNQYSLKRGPLVYSLKIGEKWIRFNEHIAGHELPHGDYEVYPTTPWNIALSSRCDASDVDFSYHGIGERPFSSQGAPISAHLMGCEIDWAIENDSAAEKHGNELLSERRQIEMIPYGCTCLRMTQMPVHFVDESR